MRPCLKMEKKESELDRAVRISKSVEKRGAGCVGRNHD